MTRARPGGKGAVRLTNRRMRVHGLAIVLATSVALGGAEAQTIRDDVKQHVEESLAKEKEKANRKAKKENAENTPKKARPTQPSTGPKPAAGKKPDAGSGGTSADGNQVRISPGSPTPKPADTGPRLPLRVIHESFQLDLRVGAGYRGWLPQQYPSVSVDPANFFTWSVGATARIFKVVSLTRARYESNNAASPRKSKVASAAKYGAWALKAAWFLAELGIDALEKVQPVVRYESRSFLTHARTKDGENVCVVPFDQDADTACQIEDNHLTISSTLETAAVGVRYNPKGGSKFLINGEPVRSPSLFFGGGYLSYLKPYQVTIGDYVLEEYLFSGRFYGGGLAFGLNWGGGVNRPYIDSWVQLGLGRVRLTKDMTLNELAPDDWLIGYIQGNLSVSFRWAPFKFAPTLLFVPSATVSGASFFFFETEVDEGEETAIPSINWDLLYTVRLAIVLTL